MKFTGWFIAMVLGVTLILLERFVAPGEGWLRTPGTILIVLGLIGSVAD